MLDSLQLQFEERDIEELFTKSIGLQKPRYVSKVEFIIPEKTIKIYSKLT